MKKVLAWWSEGEEFARKVYRQTFGSAATVLLCFAGIWLLIPAMRNWYILALGIGFLFRALAERRRAFIFAPSSVLYRPPFGHLVRVKLADIMSVEEATVPTSFFMWAHFFKGLHLRLRNGEHIYLPLDFPHRAEIFQEIVRASGSPATPSS